MAPPTILAHKSAFVTAQTLQLSQVTEPSAAWRTANESADNSLPERLIEDALFRLNHTLQQHVRRVYPSQASRHVAEQIDALFLDTADTAYTVGEGARDARDSEVAFRDDVDLTSDSAITALPSTWESYEAADLEADPAETRRYADLQSSLTLLSVRRADLGIRVERLRHLHKLLAPFDNSIQDNLITRNSDVEQELERMRVLLVRVAARIGQPTDVRSNANNDAALEDIELMEKRKADQWLGNA